MRDAAHWTNALRAVLAQGVALATELDPATFARPIPPGRSGVGSHLRHACDFVRAFLRGLATGRIDYDARERDERIEREPARAIAHLRALSAELAGLRELDLARPVRVRMEAPHGAGPDEHWHGSTLGRELAFLVSHTVHHYALVALALRPLGTELPGTFGVAPSTLAHRSARAAAAALAGERRA